MPALKGELKLKKIIIITGHNGAGKPTATKLSYDSSGMHPKLIDWSNK